MSFATPLLPARRDFAGHADALGVLHAALDAIHGRLAGGEPPPVDLGHLDRADLALVDQLLGEGEVAARIEGEPGLQAQESVFAGVWRVLHLQAAQVRRDSIEVGAIPAMIPEAARQAALRAPAPPAAGPTDGASAYAVLEELRDRQRRWRPGGPSQVINLSLLPLTPRDRACLDDQIGRGPVLIVSRGYGDCRIASTRLPRTWRVTYLGAHDVVLLDTLEVAAVPEVACAAREDLEDSAGRLAQVLQWVESA